MQLKIDIPYIRCKEDTNEWGKDEIYYALFVASGSQKNGEGQPLPNALRLEAVSDVEVDIESGHMWKPTPNQIIVDLGEAQFFGIAVALYEEDSGKIREEYLRGEGKPIFPKDWEWPEIPDNVLDPTAWAGWLVKSLSAGIKHFRQDDLLGIRTVTARVDDKFLSEPRALKYLAFTGEYEVSLVLSLSQ